MKLKIYNFNSSLALMIEQEIEKRVAERLKMPRKKMAGKVTVILCNVLGDGRSLCLVKAKNNRQVEFVIPHDDYDEIAYISKEVIVTYHEENQQKVVDNFKFLEK